MIESVKAVQGATEGYWRAPTAAGPVDATMELPGSKSITNRWLVIASLGEEATTLIRPLRARDTQLMSAALQALGHSVEWTDSDVLVTPGSMTADASIDCGLAGNVMRFVPAISGLSSGAIRFDGDARARDRPIAPLLSALRQAGMTITSEGPGSLPFVVTGEGRVLGGAVEIDSRASSQFITALLLAGCRYEHGLQINNIGPSVPSRPHIDMTIRLLQAAHVIVESQDPQRWTVLPGRPTVKEPIVEPDLSNAFAFLAAALVTHGSCTVTGFPSASVQPVNKVAEIVEAFGGSLTQTETAIAVSGGKHIRGVDLNLADVGELVPNIAAIAAVADSPSTLRGVAHLRGHETDRLAALTTELSALGCKIQQTDDGLRIDPHPLHGGVFHTYDDHRMATTAALIGLVTSNLDVENVATTSKTLPQFSALWGNMLET